MSLLNLLVCLLGPLYAKAEGPAIYKEPGHTLTEGAFLFTPEAELKARISVKEKELCKQFSEEQSKQIELLKINNKFYEERLNNFKNQNDVLSDKLVTASSSNKLENALYFLGGAVITGAMGYGIYKAATSK